MTPRPRIMPRLWSLIASAERHGIDPQRYLTSLLAKIGTASAEELEQFLPDVWKADDAAQPLMPSSDDSRVENLSPTSD